MVPKGGLEPPRVASHGPQPCASASSATSAQIVRYQFPTQPFELLTSTLSAKYQRSVRRYFVGEAAGDVLGAGESAGAAGAMLATGEAAVAGVGVASASVDCSTDCEPVIPGKESVKAMSINAAAAPIVIFDRMLAVPRGPNAVLETLPEKRSPAPDFPGCNRMTTTSTMHAKIKSPYKV